MTVRSSATNPTTFRQICRAASVGSPAFKTLSGEQGASVLGVTSRGVFVQTFDRRVLFVSFETYRGPLTLTLAEVPARLRSVQTGAPLRIARGGLVFPAAGLAISAAAGAVWLPPTRPEPAGPRLEQRARLKWMAQEIIARRGDSGLGGLLPPLLELPPSGPGQMLAGALRLQQGLADQDASRIVAALVPCLGRGPGLTPAGDDFTLGLLLALNRWPEGSGLQGELERLNRAILEAARRRTTTLSANLIECAALGQADERLVNALDCIYTGRPGPEESVSGLLAWGASSGVDALVGMAVNVLREA
ncbi:MAG: DUF2877 domain-containing protein [Anaerolineae bacterium]